MTRRSRPGAQVAAGARSFRIPRQRRGQSTAQPLAIPDRPHPTGRRDAAEVDGLSEPLVLTRTVLPVQGWWRVVEPAPTTLPPGYVAARRPVIAGPDADELRVRAWLRRRIGGVG